MNRLREAIGKKLDDGNPWLGVLVWLLALFPGAPIAIVLIALLVGSAFIGSYSFVFDTTAPYQWQRATRVLYATTVVGLQIVLLILIIKSWKREAKREGATEVLTRLESDGKITEAETELLLRKLLNGKITEENEIGAILRKLR